MGPIFNEKVDKKWNLWDPWTVHLCTVHKRPVNNCAEEKKKEKKGRENVDAARLSAIQTYTLFIYLSFLSFLKPVQFLYLFELV